MNNSYNLGVPCVWKSESGNILETFHQQPRVYSQTGAATVPPPLAPKETWMRHENCCWHCVGWYSSSSILSSNISKNLTTKRTTRWTSINIHHHPPFSVYTVLLKLFEGHGPHPGGAQGRAQRRSDDATLRSHGNSHGNSHCGGGHGQWRRRTLCWGNQNEMNTHTCSINMHKWPMLIWSFCVENHVQPEKSWLDWTAVNLEPDSWFMAEGHLQICGQFKNIWNFGGELSLLPYVPTPAFTYTILYNLIHLKPETNHIQDTFLSIGMLAWKASTALLHTYAYLSYGVLSFSSLFGWSLPSSATMKSPHNFYITGDGPSRQNI